MSKKVISLALVVVMLFSLASTSLAALGADKKLGFTVSASETTVAPGATVDIKVAITVTDEEYSWGGGVVPLAYDSSKITEATATLGQLYKESAYSPYLSFTEAYATGAEIDTGNTSADPFTIVDDVIEDENFSCPLRTEDKVYGWDRAVGIVITAQGYHDFTPNTATEIFSYKFTVPETVAPGTKIQVGIPVGAFDTDNPIGYMSSTECDYWVDYDGEVYDFTDATVELTVAAPKVVFHRAYQIQWADKDNGIVNLGFKGRFSAADFDLAFNDKNQSANVSEVGAKLTINGVEDTRSAFFVHEYETGSYEFRGILPNINLKDAEQANAEIKVEYYVMYKGTPYWSDPVITSASAIAAAAGYNA